MDCEAPRTADDLAADVVLAVAAFGRADLEAFNQATTDLDLAVPCAGEAIDPPLAAAIHRVQGIRAFVDKQPDRVTSAFLAARAAEPDWRFPTSLVRPGHPLRTEYEKALSDSLATETVPYVAGGYLTIDGVQTWDRHPDVAVLVQVFDAGGAVRETHYLWPENAWLAYEVGRPAVTREAWSPQKRAFFASSLGAGLVAGGLYGGAALYKDRYTANDADYERGPALEAANHRLVVGSVLTGAAAVALAGATVVVSF